MLYDWVGEDFDSDLLDDNSREHIIEEGRSWETHNREAESDAGKRKRLTLHFVLVQESQHDKLDFGAYQKKNQKKKNL